MLGGLTCSSSGTTSVATMGLISYGDMVLAIQGQYISKNANKEYVVTMYESL